MAESQSGLLDPDRYPYRTQMAFGDLNLVLTTESYLRIGDPELALTKDRRTELPTLLAHYTKASPTSVLLMTRIKLILNDLRRVILLG